MCSNRKPGSFTTSNVCGANLNGSSCPPNSARTAAEVLLEENRDRTICALSRNARGGQPRGAREFNRCERVDYGRIRCRQGSARLLYSLPVAAGCTTLRQDRLCDPSG